MLSEILNIAINTITPILLCAGVGAWFGRKFQPDPRIFSRLSLMIFLPALVFRSISTSTIDLSEIAPIGITFLTVSALMAAIGWGMAWLQPSLGQKTKSAFVLTVLLTNTGNFGLPFIEFTLGSAGVEYAAITLVFSAIMTNSLGIFIASSGSSSPLEGLKNILKNPLPYATVIGFLVNLTHYQMPLPLLRTVDVLANGSVPLMLMLLGVQLSNMRVGEMSMAYTRAIGIATIARLCIPVFLVFLVTRITGVTGAGLTVLMLLMSMPTAVNSAVLSYEFGSDAKFVTPVILLTTLSSLVTLSILTSILV